MTRWWRVYDVAETIRTTFALRLAPSQLVDESGVADDVAKFTMDGPMPPGEISVLMTGACGELSDMARASAFEVVLVDGGRFRVTVEPIDLPMPVTHDPQNLIHDRPHPRAGQSVRIDELTGARLVDWADRADVDLTAYSAEYAEFLVLCSVDGVPVLITDGRIS